MKNVWLGGLTLAAMIAGPAMAADMAVKAPVYKAPPPAYSWTGCYVGGNFGSPFAKSTWNGGGLSSQESSTDLMGGLQAGCNYQISTWVFGAQGDYDWMKASGVTTDSANIALQDTTSVKALSSATGRVGYAWESLLVYGKGGGAWLKDSYMTSLLTTNATFSTASETRSGITVGGGLEFVVFKNLSIFAEYDWYDFGNRSTSFTPVGVGGATSTNIRITESTVKTGLNWKLFPW
jgi:outer membrane immunogenic protein